VEVISESSLERAKTGLPQAPEADLWVDDAGEGAAGAVDLFFFFITIKPRVE